jgi:ubiquinone/menaquinone biosynthesis C-methylase UbiE
VPAGVRSTPAGTVPGVASRTDRFVPALGFERLTSLYDPVVKATTRERAFKRRLLDQAAIQPGDRVLDLGCGTGTLAIAAKRREPTAKVAGLDGDREMLRRARTKAADARVDLDPNEGLADRLPYPDSSFDKVLSTLLFHHLASDVKRAAAGEIARVLRRGGELHLADWGRAPDPLARALFVVVQLFDGFEQTGDNVAGRLPSILEAGGLSSVRERGRLRAAFGSLSLYSARRDPE